LINGVLTGDHLIRTRAYGSLGIVLTLVLTVSHVGDLFNYDRFLTGLLAKKALHNMDNTALRIVFWCLS